MHEEDIYNEDEAEEMEEEDEISPGEEGFMEGYEEGSRIAKCKQCGNVLVGENIFELDIGKKHYRFCSEQCAEKFKK